MKIFLYWFFSNLLNIIGWLYQKNIWLFTNEHSMTWSCDFPNTFQVCTCIDTIDMRYLFSIFKHKFNFVMLCRYRMKLLFCVFFYLNIKKSVVFHVKCTYTDTHLNKCFLFANKYFIQITNTLTHTHVSFQST